MSGTDPVDTGWTLRTLYVHFTAEISHIETRLLDKFEASKEAVGLASEANEARLDSLNELRTMVQDQQGRFSTKSEMEARLSSLADKVEALTKRLDQIGDTTAGASKMWLLVLGVAMLIGSVVSIYVQTRGPAGH